MSWSSAAALIIVLGIAPALPGVATRTRALLTGRRGPRTLQLYFELMKLLRKRAVYSATTTWVFRAAPLTGVVTAVAAACLLPLDGRHAVATFAGDFMLFAGLLALARWLGILAALDTGSSFEGMGASREAMIGAFGETGLFLVFAALVLATGEPTLTGMLGPAATARTGSLAPLAMIGGCLFVLLLAESSRVPFDDPATHLELTMIHEVAVLDHSGPDLALLLYGASVKLALYAALVAAVLIPRATRTPQVALALLPVTLIVAAALVGVVEAVMARVRLNRIPQLLIMTAVLAAFASILLLAHQ